MAKFDHPSFTQPTKLDVPLWRYMDLSKFAALLQKRSLVFARSDNLGDPFEGSIPLPNANMLQQILQIRKFFPEQDPYKDMTVEQLTRMFTQLSDFRKKIRKSTYISCWHMNESESAGMWKLYSKSNEAVCIRTKYSLLGGLLPDECYMGIINYIDFNTTPISSNNLFNPYLIKRRSFSHEREARAIISDYSLFEVEDTPAIKEININIDKLIEEVFVSPDAPNWFQDVVSDLAKKYGLSARVEHSEINAVPLY